MSSYYNCSAFLLSNDYSCSYMGNNPSIVINDFLKTNGLHNNNSSSSFSFSNTTPFYVGYC